ncbi:MAG: alanine--tRNA ligase [Bacteroidota bacterium]|nr:alanine--tRNA ligase [Bacteroidota bacterium]
MKSQQIRQKFLHFFEKKGHLIVPSAPIVLKDDPTLMFNNSGMAQFKEFFLGNGTPPSKRIADTQKCLRVSGKHNDLEDVGFDTYHHTMFEMLGNWSFGDYFKKEAIAWAWEFLTEVLKIDKDRLYVSVFEGNEEENVPFDQEAFDIWKQFVSEDRIILGNKKDNFWEMGDQGPCGPCSEIHVDLRSDEDRKAVSGRSLVNNDHPQVVEIWNNVFMEFNRKADGSLEKLPQKHVDTGMGFERLCMAMQGVTSNYDTDIFTPLIAEVESLTGLKYTNNEVKNISEEQNKINIAIRVVVDHIRAVAFAIADGQLPSNNGAGYVIRRILRRAIRYGFTFLGKKEPFIHQLVKVLAKQMGDAFPEILKQKELVTNVIKEEESSFLRTLEQGLLMLDAMMNNATDKQISGSKAFELYDTYGFPIDLTALILSEKGFSLDEKGFEENLKKQKERSRAAAQMKADDWVILREDDEEEFIGYDTLEAKIRITKYRKVESQKDGTLYQLVFNVTPFYPEGGGQVGDKGFLTSSNGEVTYIIDTKKENNLIIHISENLPSNLDEPFRAEVRGRHLTEANHTATHLLHQALREVLGTHVEQRGSRVDHESLRFDFSHFQKMTEDEIKEVQKLVNQCILQKIQLQEHRNISMKEAMDAGAMALFGEKYGDRVRMIQFGDSKELCGGTHAKNTGDIWFFKIVSEGAVAAGIRRVEAITRDKVREYFQAMEGQTQQLTETLKSKDLVKSVEKILDENAQLKAELEAMKKEKAQGEVKNWKNDFVQQGDKQLLVKRTSLDAGSVKDIVFQLKRETPKSVIVILSDAGEKPMISVGVSDDLDGAYHAGNLVKELAKEIQGGGGGNAGFATAGGKKLAGLEKAEERAKEV